MDTLARAPPMRGAGRSMKRRPPATTADLVPLAPVPLAVHTQLPSTCPTSIDPSPISSRSNAPRGRPESGADVELADRAQTKSSVEVRAQTSVAADAVRTSYEPGQQREEELARLGENVPCQKIGSLLQRQFRMQMESKLIHQTGTKFVYLSTSIQCLLGFPFDRNVRQTAIPSFPDRCSGSFGSQRRPGSACVGV
jgi:hypothetical protein